ncbi:helix-turn-helix domain-containing protein [Amycolatopsis sp. cmx-4-61]|uniref:helix-turn-helix domain-containing protein n=1 Tax=Amycolatopsis sp. cmx-4-61 TaxID=2790937 RepID=UPI0039783FE3
MCEHLPLSAGQAIAVLRKGSGLTQRQLAARAHVSLSLLSKVEVGDRAASHALLAAAARILRVPVERLHGQPYSETHHDERIHRDVEALRTVLRCYDLPDDVPPRPLEALAADVQTLVRLRSAASYGRLAARLPALLPELIAAGHHGRPGDIEQANTLLLAAYHAAHTLTYRLGYPDLAESIEHKLAYAAERTSDPLAGGLAQWARAQSFQSAGDYAHGLRLMATARAELDDELQGRKPAMGALVVCGSLHLRSVTLASRAGDADLAREHLAAARELAGRLPGADQVRYGLTFGHANTATHEVAAHVELGDGAAAIAAAQHWRPSRHMPRTRRGHHHIDLARARLIHGDRSGALAELKQAKRIAPQQTRHHPMVRETTAVLVSLHRRSNPDLVSYADWLGLTA